MASIKFNIVISYRKEAGDKPEEDHIGRTKLISLLKFWLR